MDYRTQDDFMRVIPYYTESHRHYHDLHHIVRMLKFHEIHKNSTGIEWSEMNERKVYLAILYHDVVYQVTNIGISNEEASAEFFTDHFSSTGISEEEYDEIYSDVSKMIIATEHHFDGTIYEDELVNYFLDLDLLGLTTFDITELCRDQNNIDSEFLTVFPIAYVMEKRLAFLKNVMRPFFKLRALKDRFLSDRAIKNIEFLVQMYTKIVEQNDEIDYEDRKNALETY